MSCSQESGQCYCKENVEGRTCDHCTYGSYQYPTCETCDCELSGTTERICDQVGIYTTVAFDQVSWVV
jgi:laminin alpha 3/5